jgi:CheY-like chemotaxis protein
VASDGAQALRLIAEADKKALPYDLTLMDWKMPAWMGWRPCANCRAST